MISAGHESGSHLQPRPHKPEYSLSHIPLLQGPVTLYSSTRALCSELDPTSIRKFPTTSLAIDLPYICRYLGYLPLKQKQLRLGAWGLAIYTASRAEIPKGNGVVLSGCCAVCRGPSWKRQGPTSLHSKMFSSYLQSTVFCSPPDCHVTGSCCVLQFTKLSPTSPHTGDGNQGTKLVTTNNPPPLTSVFFEPIFVSTLGGSFFDWRSSCHLATVIGVILPTQSFMFSFLSIKLPKHRINMSEVDFCCT